MADYTQSSEVEVLAPTEITHPSSLIGSAQTSDGKIGVRLWIYHGFIEATANTNPGTFHVQVNPATSNEGWIDYAVFPTTNATPTSIDPTNAEGIGDTLVETSSTTGAAVDQLRYWQDATAADGEWIRIQSFVTNTSFTLTDGLTNAKAATDLTFSDAELFTLWVDLAGVSRYRVIYHHQGATAANTAIWVRGIEVTAIV